MGFKFLIILFIILLGVAIVAAYLKKNDIGVVVTVLIFIVVAICIGKVILGAY